MARWPESQPQNDPMEFLWNSLSSNAQRVSWYMAKPISFTKGAVDRNYLLVCARLDLTERDIQVDIAKGLGELRERGVLGEESLLDFYRRRLRDLLEKSASLGRNLSHDERSVISDTMYKMVEYQKHAQENSHMEHLHYYLHDDLQAFMEDNFIFLGGEEEVEG